MSPHSSIRRLADALDRIRRYQPAYLVVAAGFDTAKGDPTGTWSNLARDFVAIGRVIGAEGYPTLIVQEGGYRVRTLGTNARSFFNGLARGQDAARMPHGRVAPAAAPTLPDVDDWPISSGAMPSPTDDVARIRHLVSATGYFTATKLRSQPN